MSLILMVLALTITPPGMSVGNNHANTTTMTSAHAEMSNTDEVCTLPVSAAPTRFKAGDVVVIEGLVSKPEHNGSTARVVSTDLVTGRHHVELFKCGTLLSIKPSNARRAIAAAGLSHDGCLEKADLQQRARKAQAALVTDELGERGELFLEISKADEDTLRAMRAASPALQKWWSDGKVKYTNNGKAKLHVHRGSKQTV